MRNNEEPTVKSEKDPVITEVAMYPNAPAISRNGDSSWKRKRRMSTTCSIARVLSTTLLLLSLRSTQSRSQVDGCIQALYNADTDADQRIDENEFAIFIQLLESDVTTPSAFASLPLSLQDTFFTLACGCQESEALVCCLEDNAHLPIDGTNPNETPTKSQQNSLVRICTLVEDSMERTSMLAPVSAPALAAGARNLAPSGNITTAATPAPAPALSDESQTSTPPPTFRDEAITKVHVAYTIVVRNGIEDESDYQTDLIAALDNLVVQVSTRRRLRTRRLQTILLPTVIENVTDKGGFTMTPSVNDDKYYDGVGPCPADLGNPETDLCQEVTALIKIVVVGLVNPEMAHYEFEVAINTAIMDGDLQQSLEQTSPDTTVTVLNGQATSLGDGTMAAANEQENNDADGLSSGATAGIVISTCAVLGLLGFLFVAHPRPQVKRNRKVLMRLDTDMKSSNQTIPCDVNQLDVENALTFQESYSLELAEEDKEITEQALPRSPLASTQPATSVSDTSGTMLNQSNGGSNNVNKNDPVIMLPSKDSTGGGSKESDSGWSTDEEHSSMGTADSESFKTAKGFDDEKMDTKIFDWKNIEITQMNNEMDSSQRSVVMPTATSVKNLENAIMIGDWAAVGASAAALISGAMDYDSDLGESTDAGGSYLSGSLGQSLVEEWRSRETNGTSWQAASDVNKATQLDQLIEKGDWEAVIQAAARFEAEQQLGEESTIGYLPSTTTISIQDDSKSTEKHQPPVAPSTPVKESSFRSQVMELVQQVVPGELGNIDDMLDEFEGREEDLIETLKAMKTQHEPQGGTPPKKKRDSPREYSK